MNVVTAKPVARLIACAKATYCMLYRTATELVTDKRWYSLPIYSFLSAYTCIASSAHARGCTERVCKSITIMSKNNFLQNV